MRITNIVIHFIFHPWTYIVFSGRPRNYDNAGIKDHYFGPSRMHKLNLTIELTWLSKKSFHSPLACLN